MCVRYGMKIETAMKKRNILSAEVEVLVQEWDATLEQLSPERKTQTDFETRDMLGGKLIRLTSQLEITRDLLHNAQMLLDSKTMTPKERLDRLKQCSEVYNV